MITFHAPGSAANRLLMDPCTRASAIAGAFLSSSGFSTASTERFPPVSKTTNPPDESRCGAGTKRRPPPAASRKHQNNMDDQRNMRYDRGVRYCEHADAPNRWPFARRPLADEIFLTFRYRVKDATTGKHLARMAVAVNQVWNYCGEIQNASRRLNRKWPSFPDLCRLVAGSTKELGIHSDTLQDVLRHWCAARDRIKRRPAWRVSSGARRSLGWVPFQCARPLKVNGDTVRFMGRKYRLWLSRAIPDDIRSGNFAQDADGRWYLNLVCAVPTDHACGNGEIGIDLGLKEFATLSTGEKVANPRHLAKHAKILAKAQRAGRKRLARKVHRKIAAQRRHFLHETSAHIIKANALVVVGDVNSAALVRTRMAKSVLDAGWSAFRSMLRYKAIRHGAIFVQANERYSTQTCSCCGSRNGSPRGLKGLRVRSWVCSDCGADHDRDVNAARNILRSGRSVALQSTGIPAE